MAERSLANQWMLLTSAFTDSDEGQRCAARMDLPHAAVKGATLRDSLGSASLRDALALVRNGLAEDLGLAPQGLDAEHIAQLMSVWLPGRMAGNETFRLALPDILEEFLLFTARELGIASGYEWSRAVDCSRGDYARALKNPSRPRPAPPRYEPETRPGAKLGRNDPCPCGSGRKYKKCCAAPAAP